MHAASIDTSSLFVAFLGTADGGSRVLRHESVGGHLLPRSHWGEVSHSCPLSCLHPLRWQMTVPISASLPTLELCPLQTRGHGLPPGLSAVLVPWPSACNTVPLRHPEEGLAVGSPISPIHTDPRDQVGRSPRQSKHILRTGVTVISEDAFPGKSRRDVGKQPDR